MLLLTLLFAVCGNPDSDAPTLDGNDTAGDTSVEAALFSETLEKEPCAVLSLTMVSEAVNVPADQIRQQQIAGLCRYTWDGGMAELAKLTVLPSIDEAQQRFERTYRPMTAEDRTRGEAALKEELDRRREAGELSEAQRTQADTVGSVIGNLVAATTYEPIDAIGDQAVYDGTVHTMEGRGIGAVTMAESRLHLRAGNLLASVAADLFDPGDDLAARKAGPPLEVRQRNREMTLALGRALLANLSQQADSD